MCTVTKAHKNPLDLIPTFVQLVPRGSGDCDDDRICLLFVLFSSVFWSKQIAVHNY